MSDDEKNEEIKRRILYEVGYGKPPKEHQFKKKETGNAGGRPRGSPPDLNLSDQPTLQAALRVSRRRVKVRDGDGVREVEGRDALVDAIFANGVAKGNARYAGLALDLIRTAEQADAREIHQRNEFWSNYQAKARAVLDEAKSNNLPEPELVPHPDDIVIDWEVGPKIIGPFDDESSAQMKSTLAYRRAFLLQAALDEKLWPQDAGPDPRDGPGSAFEFAKLMNQTLPPRLQQSEYEMLWEVDRLSRHNQRWLLREVHATWRKLGKHFKRGHLFPRLEWSVKLIVFLRHMGAELSEPDVVADQAFASRFEKQWRQVETARR